MTSPGTAPNFDRVARIYCWAEYLALGSQLRKTRESLLPAIRQCRRALLLGDGDGRFAAVFLRQAPLAHVQAVDLSERMLQLLAQRCARDGNTARLRTEQGSALAVEAAQDCDVVTTHFLLDCLSQTEVAALAERLGRQVRAGTLWVVSDFDLPPQPLRRTLARLYIRMLYLAFRLLTGLRVQELPQVPAALLAAGWIRLVRRERMGGLLYSELWRLETPPGEGVGAESASLHAQLPF